jgi:drug/metabolite transporter (DMT)-like permease
MIWLCSVPLWPYVSKPSVSRQRSKLDLYMRCMKTEKRSALFIIAACSLWALDLLVRRPLTGKMNFVHIVFIESLVGLLSVVPWLVKNGAKELGRFQRREWLLAAFLGGMGMTVAGILSTSSILQTSTGIFSFFQIFQPLFVVYAANLFLKEKIDNLYFYWGVWVGLSALLMFSQELGMLLMRDIYNLPGAIVVALTVMMIWGLCTIAGKGLLQNHSPMVVVAARWIFAFALSTVFLMLEEVSFPFQSLTEVTVWARFFFIAGVSGTVSMYLYYGGMKELAAGKVSFLELTYPAMGIMLAVLTTFDEVSFFQAIGVASFFAFLLLFIGKKDEQTA